MKAIGFGVFLCLILGLLPSSGCYAQLKAQLKSQHKAQLKAPPEEVALYDYRLIKRIPHSRADFTQGLEIKDGNLYQGTGLNGHSKLQVFELASGKLLRQRPLASAYFGEGITLLGDQIIQLTWHKRRAFIYDQSTFKRIGDFALPGQGWGLTNDGNRLIYSDGTNRLRFIDPGNWQVTGSVAVTAYGCAIHYLNELEWTPDYLLANVWQSDSILMIDLATGRVTGQILLQGLHPASERQEPANLLNGIARNPADASLWVTGKRWPWVYQIELLPRENPNGSVSLEGKEDQEGQEEQEAHKNRQAFAQALNQSGFPCSAAQRATQ